MPRERALAYLERFRDALDVAAARGPDGADLPVVRELRVGPGAFADRSLMDAAVRERYGVTVLDITRESGERVPHPAARTPLRAGDRLRVFGLAASIDALAAGGPGAPASPGGRRIG